MKKAIRYRLIEPGWEASPTAFFAFTRWWWQRQKFLSLSFPFVIHIELGPKTPSPCERGIKLPNAAVTQLTHNSRWLSTHQQRHTKPFVEPCLISAPLQRPANVYGFSYLFIFFVQFQGSAGDKSQLLIGWPGWASVQCSAQTSHSMQVSNRFQPRAKLLQLLSGV